MLIAHDLETAENHAETVEELYLSGASITELPQFVFQMPKLRVLDISANYISESNLRLSELPQLKFLSLERMDLRRVPAGLFALEGLENLRLNKNDLWGLPNELVELKSLRVLEAAHCTLKSFPESLCQLQHLESLKLCNNGLTSLPEAIAGLRSLKFLNISDNQIFRLPSELALLTELSNVMLENNDLQLGYDAGIAQDFSRFLKQTANGKLPAHERQVLAEVMLGNLDTLAQREPMEVLQALDTTFSEVRKWAPEALYPALPDPFVDGPPETICMLGQFPGLHKTKVTQQLKAMRIKVSSKPRGKNCVVIAGDRPGKRIATALKRGCKIGVEGHLSDFLAREEGQYLAAGKGGNNLMVANVLQMLRSGNTETVRLALNLMAGGGIPKDVHSDLAGLSLFGRDSIDPVTDFLAEHGPKRLHRFLEMVKKTVPDMDGSVELDESEALKMVLRHPEIDRVVLLRHAIKGGKTYQLGFSEVLDLPVPLQKEMLTEILNHGALEFNNIGLRHFPPAFINLSGLKSLSLDGNNIEELPSDIGMMKSLCSLSLSGNHLRELPESFYNLDQLDNLNLGDNRFHEVSDALGKMKSLQNLMLHTNPLDRLPESFTEQNQLKFLDLRSAFRNGVPELVSHIKGITMLGMEDCGIENLDHWRPTWEKIVWLSLDQNPLSTIPEWIGDHQSLVTLSLNECPANRLPKSIRGAKNLATLGLPAARHLDWIQVCEIIDSLPKLEVVYYDSSADPGTISYLTKGRSQISFYSYDPQK